MKVHKIRDRPVIVVRSERTICGQRLYKPSLQYSALWREVTCLVCLRAYQDRNIAEKLY